MAFGKKKGQDTKEIVAEIQESVLAENGDENEVSYGDGMLPAAVKPKKKRKVGRVVMIALVVLVVGWIVLNSVLSALRGPDPTFVQVQPVVSGEVRRTLSTTGTITSANKVTVYSPVSAPLAEANLELGGVVSAGSVLFTYDTTDLERSYQTAAAAARLTSLQGQATTSNSNKAAQNVGDYQAGIDNLYHQRSEAQRIINELSAAQGQAQTELDGVLAQYEWYNNEADIPDHLIADAERLQNLIAGYTRDITIQSNDLASASQQIAVLESARDASDSAVLDDNGRAQLQASGVSPALNSQAALEMLEKGQAGVTAPITGVVTALAADVGTLAAQYGMLCTLESIDEVNVVVSLSRYDLETVQVGQPVQIESRGTTYTGVVAKIDNMASQGVSSNGTATSYVGATIKLQNPDSNITLGLDAKVEIETGSASNTLLVPISAVNNDVTGTYVYIMQDGYALRREVTLGISGGNEVEIQDGLSEGQEVILSSQNIAEGIPVSTDLRYYTATNMLMIG